VEHRLKKQAWVENWLDQSGSKRGEQQDNIHPAAGYQFLGDQHSLTSLLTILTTGRSTLSARFAGDTKLGGKDW